MRLPRSLQALPGLSLGMVLTLFWIGTAMVTAVNLQHEMDEVLASALQETAQPLLPLAVQEIFGRDDDGITQRLGAIREHSELITYIVRDARGCILLQSHAADPDVFPPYDGTGFRQTARLNVQARIPPEAVPASRLSRLFRNGSEVSSSSIPLGEGKEDGFEVCIRLPISLSRS